MGGKYPTPEEAKSNFEDGVDHAKDKWVERTKKGADKYLMWFAGFASELYPVIATLPDRTGNPEENVERRVKPVAKKISEIAKLYRKAKIEAIKKEAKELAESLKVLVTAK
jgi:hypothetical protein